jgi:hypothetical protein
MAEVTPARIFSVSQLKKLWERNDAAGPDDALGLLQLYEMPSWEDLCRELDWHHYLVENGSFGKKQFGFHGVYRLIALASKGVLSKPATLNRACGQDTSGTLYIGEASNLSRRLNQLRRSAGHRREASHGAVRMLQRIARLDYPAEKLGIALMFTGRDTRSVEQDLLNA